MVAPQHDRDDPRIQQRLEPILDHLVGVLGVTGIHREVPVIHPRTMVEDPDVQNLVVMAQQRRDAPDSLGAKSRPHPVGGAGIEGNPHDCEVDPLRRLDVGQTHERLYPREPGRLPRINRSIIRHTWTHIPTRF